MIGQIWTQQTYMTTKLIVLKKRSNRQKWTEEEIQEIKEYCDKFLETKTCPSKNVHLSGREKQNERGALAQRFCHTLVKKISNMNKK